MKQKPPQSLLGLPLFCAFAPLLFGAFALAACGGSISGQKTGAGGNSAGAAGSTGTGSGGTTGLGGMSMVGGVSGGPGSMGFPAGPLDLCQGLIQDKAAHPMTTLAKPALGAAVTEPQFNTTIRRITAVTGTSNTPALRPLYSTVAAWNADESRLLLLNISAGRHELYDGKTYAFIRGLVELNPPDVEQIFWHTTDPDLLLYVENRNFIRYHVGEARKEIVTTFDFCTGGGAGGGEDPMFSSFDSNRFGLGCGNQVFIYDLASNTVIARKTLSGNPVQIAPSGALGFLSDTGDVTDAGLNIVRRLDMKEPYGHASMGRWPTGEDTWNGQVFDDGPMGHDARRVEGRHRPQDGISVSARRPRVRDGLPPAGMGGRVDVRQDVGRRVARRGDPDRRHRQQQGVPRRPPPQLGQGQHHAERAVLGRAARCAEPDGHAHRLRQ